MLGSTRAQLFYLLMAENRGKKKNELICNDMMLENEANAIQAMDSVSLAVLQPVSH